MNLIQIQDRLKDMPNDPRTMQLLTAYANGASPAVPPYLALGELNRRKQLAEKAKAESAGQAPQGSVKEQLESGIMALQQQQMQQQQAQQQMAQQAAQQPVMAAGGGLLAQLMSYPAARYRSGGIISFQEAGSVDDRIEEEDENSEGVDQEETAAENMLTDRLASAVLAQAASGSTTRDQLAEVIRRGQEAMASSKPVRTSYLQQRKEILKANPELAAADADYTAEQLRRLDELQSARRAEIERQREEAASMRPSIFQQLGRAAMQTRGRSGIDALAAVMGGYSDIAAKDQAAAIKQEQDLRLRDIELQQTRMEALNKIDEIKRARAEGDVQKELQSRKDYENLLKAHNTSTAQLFGRQAAALGRLAGAETTAASRERVAETAARSRQSAAETAARARLQAAGIVKPGERERIAREIAALRAAGKDEEADRLQAAYTGLGGGTAGVGQTNAMRAALNIRLREVNRVLDPKNLDSTPEQKAAAQAEKDEILQAIRELAPTKPASKPAAAPSNTPPANILKKGVNTTFTNGQTWTLDDNGQPKRVK